MDIKRRHILIKKIQSSVILYFFVCFIFIVLSLFCIFIGWFSIKFDETSGITSLCFIYSIAGILLIVEMLRSFRLKAKIPNGYKLISRNHYPALFKIIDEVTDNLHLQHVHSVYIAPDATSAIFIQPQIINLIKEPRRNLVLGMALLSQFDDDELRALLYHEFGHYVQKDMHCSHNVYTVVQFSHSFLDAHIDGNAITFEILIKSFLLQFAFIVIVICNRINTAYDELARYMEDDADDVAVQHVGASTLKRALLHAYCIHYNYCAAIWGKRLLKENGIEIDNIYGALTHICSYSFPPKKLVNHEIFRRIGRFSDTNGQPCFSETTVSSTLPPLFQNAPTHARICTSFQFAEWMREGVKIYQSALFYRRSVILEIHLASHRHKLPLFNSKYKVILDGKVFLGFGNFLNGYTIKRYIAPGEHVLSFTAPVGVDSKDLTFTVETNAKYRVELDYKYQYTCYRIFAESITRVA